MRVRPVRPVFTGVGGAVDFDSLRGVFFMSDLKQAAQELLDSWDMPFNFHPSAHRFEKLRAALAQPIIPPKIKGDKTQLVVGGDDLPTLTKWTPQPAQPDPVEVREGWEYMREKGLLRKPLTDEALMALVDATIKDGRCEFARAIEKAHGIGGEA
jgi:hypothetical protein